MKIQYKRKKLNSNLWIGIVWLIIGLLTLSYDGQKRWMDYGYIFMAVLYLGQYFYESRNQYLTIKNGKISKNRFFGRTIELNQINWIKKYAGDYILKTDKQELTINTDWIDEKSILELNKVLGQLKLSPEKTPFANKTYT
ncbi:hypothetical protein [Maribacter sp.]|uniref:hypothetical protein n=1 Tax=Maribacter sp. TaxID=1897614 RepID=UPI0025C2D9F1|nr:hypothetical protein [Maribacter sp.]